jgi:hypothetical protein
MRTVCIGCDREQPIAGSSYGPICRQRLRDGTPLDLDDLPTRRESRRLRSISLAHRVPR